MDNPTSLNQSVLLITTLGTLGATVVAAFLQVWRDRQKDRRDDKQREWDVADRKEHRDAIASTLRTETQKVSTDLRAETARVDENTKAEALKVATALIAESARLDAIRQTDAEKAAAALKMETERVAATSRAQAEILASAIHHTSGAVLGEIQKNTEISTIAFKEANDVNQKIAALLARINNLENQITK